MLVLVLVFEEGRLFPPASASTSGLGVSDVERNDEIRDSVRDVLGVGLELIDEVLPLSPFPAGNTSSIDDGGNSASDCA